jgi:hypothetical protein
MLGQGGGHGLWMLLPQLGTAGDIGEQKRNSSTRNARLFAGIMRCWRLDWLRINGQSIGSQLSAGGFEEC